jgi:hypothetical protein
MKISRGRMKWAAAFCLAAMGVNAWALAQTAQLEARVTAASGLATLIRGAGASGPIQRGNLLSPGDVIDTGASGRVILTLTDGSQAVIHPNSRVVIKDFRATASARELLDVMIGYVRIKIYHAGKRPNPYRVNTPLASIAVRGTSFSVDVAATGETRVEVYEGMVEVTSQTNPQQKKLITPGRSVVVRPSGDIGLLAPGPGSELNAVTRLSVGDDPISSISAAAAGQINNITSSTTQLPFGRFLAYADLHFDALENPAYASEFAASDGRFYLLPSFSAARKFDQSRQPTRTGALRDFDYTAAEQLSFFTPIQGTRFVVGGAATLAYTDLQGGHSQDSSSIFTVDTIAKTGLTNYNVSLMAARRMGMRERTSLGLQLDYLEGRGNFESATAFGLPQYTPGASLRSRTNGKRARLTLGLTQDLAPGRKLGVFYRRSAATSVFRNEFHPSAGSLGQDGEPAVVSAYQFRSTADANEIGARWRSPLRSRLFYGLHGMLQFETIGSTNSFAPEPSRGDSRARRAYFGGGVGYALRPHTVVGLDVGGGAMRSRYEYDSRASSFQTSFHQRFLTVHAGGQTDFARRFFANASLFWSREWNRFDSGRYRDNRFFANLGPGVRLTRTLSAQYLFSISDGPDNRPSHSMLLRYNFGRGAKE